MQSGGFGGEKRTTCSLKKQNRHFCPEPFCFLGAFTPGSTGRQLSLFFLCGSDSQLQCDVGTKETKRKNGDDPDEVVSGEVISHEVMNTKTSRPSLMSDGLRTIREAEEKRSGFPSSLIHVVPSELHYSRDCL